MAKKRIDTERLEGATFCFHQCGTERHRRGRGEVEEKQKRGRRSERIARGVPKESQRRGHFFTSKF